MLSKLLQLVKGLIDWMRKNADHIILFAIFLFFGLFSFASGYIIAKYQDREPIQIQQQ